MKAYERLIKYAKVYTTSDPESETTPSTKRQFDLANILVEEMKEIGIQDVKLDESCYVYGVIPATKGYEDKPSIGFIAHMDTAPAAPGENVNPQIVENYNGEDLTLLNGTVLSVEKFPHLKSLKGRTLITTDGSTLLGADDKAGIAEIMTACEKIINENIPHGKICIGFTPDEEIGRGANKFDVKNFGAQFAYTMDGGVEGEISYGFMYHGITYPNEAFLPEEKNKMTVNFWEPVMKKGGIIEFIRPEECKQKRIVKEMMPKKFGKGNFSGLSEFNEEEVAN